MDSRDVLGVLQLLLSATMIAIIGYVTLVGSFQNSDVVVFALLAATTFLFLYLEFTSDSRGGEE